MSTNTKTPLLILSCRGSVQTAGRWGQRRRCPATTEVCSEWDPVWPSDVDQTSGRDAKKQITCQVLCGCFRFLFGSVLVFNLTRAVQPVATCRQSLYVHKPATVIVTSFSLWRLAPIRRWRRSKPPFSLWCHSHCDVIRYWAGHAHRYWRTDVRTPYRV